MSPRAGSGGRGPARHERPVIDEAALAAARTADRVVAAAREVQADRWVAYFEAMPDHLRDDEIADLRRTALKARSAFGPKDSLPDVLPDSVTRPFRDAIDRLLKELARRDVTGG